MLVELDNLINFIQTEYIKLTQKWEKSSLYIRTNLKDNLICDLLDNKPILDSIVNYREFINQNNIQLVFNLLRFNTETIKINFRTKAKNSIELKINNYIKKHENGKVPISKCFNDLFGIRIISSEKLTFDMVSNLIKTKYSNLKCIDSSNNGYKATHIYFRNGNYAFQWELQVWNKCDEINNIISHEIYKQDYIKWEIENKGDKI